MINKKKILLTFDTEEFDLPLEYNQIISKEEQIKISLEGLNQILELFKKHDIKATFFTTAYFAENSPEIMSKIVKEHHEIASHMYYHSDYCRDHILSSKEKLEDVCNTKIFGIRSPRFKPLNSKLIEQAGYLYNSSLNPTFIPGRYNNFKEKKTLHTEKGYDFLVLPVSVSTFLRFPLFWLSFKNISLKLFLLLSKKALRDDGYLHLYFHPWEFVDLRRFKIPFYIKRKSGEEMLIRLEKFIHFFKEKNEFTTVLNFLNSTKTTT